MNALSSKSKFTIIIPSRYGSTRFPGKPLHLIHNRSLLERVWAIGNSVPNSETIIATDDHRIAEHAEEFGGKVIMTSPKCRNGTERVLEAARTFKEKPEIIINLQGDAPLIPPHIISETISALMADKSVGIATPATLLSKEQLLRLQSQHARGIIGGTTVTFGVNQNALYFSKSIIPCVSRWRKESSPPVYKHIGLYVFRYETLEKFVSLPPSNLEELEQLEQLRALENGIPIKVVPVDLKGRTLCSVDNPEDAKVVEEIISQEGELA